MVREVVKIDRCGLLLEKLDTLDTDLIVLLLDWLFIARYSSTTSLGEAVDKVLLMRFILLDHDYVVKVYWAIYS